MNLEKPIVNSMVAALVIGAQSGTVLSQSRSEDGVRNQLQIEEVVVTARKRAESFLDVPVVSTTVTQETLERTKTDDLYTLANRVPSLLLGDSVNSTGTQLSLRGIGTIALNSTMDQSVSLNIDGLPISQALAYSVGMFDVAQVEVLKGPQALFFGKNSTAGVISLRSADPTEEVEKIVRLGYENEAEEKQVDLILSGPVSDSLKLRLAMRYSDHEGFFKNEADVIPGTGSVQPKYSNLAPTENWIARGTALFEPNERLSARLKLNYNDYRMQGGASILQVGYCPEGTGGIPELLDFPFIGGDDCELDDVARLPWFDPAAFPDIGNQGVPFDDRTQAFGSLEIDYELTEALTLNSVTGYYDNEFDILHLANTTGTTIALSAEIGFENTQFTQEFRLTSDYADKPLNFMVGAFYQEAEMTNEVIVRGSSAFGLPPVVQHPVFDVDVRSVSLFGQLIWDITPELELAAGARWTDEEREMEETNFGPLQGPIGPVARPDPEISSSNISPEITLTYKPSDTWTAFASYKTGFKSGSYNTISYVPPDRLASFDDEEAKGGELGLKTQTRDNRLTGTFAVYYYEYTDLQVGALELAENQGGVPAPFLRTINAASATVEGVEFELAYSPAAIEGLTLNAAATFNRTEYDEFSNAPCGNGQTIAQGCNQLLNPLTGRYTAQDLSGERLVRAPEWSGFLGLNQVVPLGGGMTLNFGANANYTSEYTTHVPDLPGFEQDDFIKYDANIAIRGRNDAWELALIGRNLTDEYTTGWCANANLQNSIFGGQIAGAEMPGPAGNDESACFVERGRQLWARFRLSF